MSRAGPLAAGLLALTASASAEDGLWQRLELHGFVSQGWMRSTGNEFLAGSTTDGSFEFTEVGLNVQSQLDDRLRIGLQFFARDLGGYGDLEPGIDWAFADYLVHDALHLAFGRVKVSRGFFQEIGDYDFLRPWAVLPTAVYSPVARETVNAYDGGQVYGALPLGEELTLRYEASLGAVPFTSDGDLAELNRQIGIPQTDEVSAEWAAAGYLRLEWPSADLAAVGSVLWIQDYVNDGALGTTDLRAEFSRWMTWLVGLQWSPGPWEFSAEYQRRPWKWDETIDPAVGPTQQREVSRDQEGAYVSAAWRFQERWQLAAYAGAYYADAHDREGDAQAARGADRHLAWQRDYCLTLACDVTPDWIVKVEGHVVDGAAQVPITDNGGSLTTAPDTERDWFYVVVRTSVSF